MVSWVVLNVILVICSNYSQLTYFLFEPMVVVQKSTMNKSVRPSVWELSWNWLFLLFFGNQHGLREPCRVVYHRAGFFENKIFARENGDNRPSLWFFKCIGKFTYYFFSTRSIMKVCTTCCIVTQFGIILFPEIWTKMLLTN